ncbi:MAG TPA: hypothetical protein VIC85_05605 [Ktedonobacterales bacterium]
MDPTAQTQTTLDALTARLAALEAAHTRQWDEQTRRHDERAHDQERMVALEHDNARLRDEVAALRAEGPVRACRHSLAVLYSIHKLTGIVICRPYFAHTIASLTFAKCLLYMRMGLDAVEQLCYHARTRGAVARPVLVRVAASADHSGERPPGPSHGRHPRIWWARIRLYASLLD